MNKFIKTVPLSSVNYEFLRSLNGLLGLTDREIDLLSIFLDLENRDSKVKGQRKSIDGTANRKEIMHITTITKDNLSRYIKRLKAKRIIVRDYKEDINVLNKAILPVIIGNKVVQITMILKVKEDEIQN